MIACLIVGPVTLLTPGNSVSGQTIQFYPIRTAPLGSPAGTVGDPVTPTVNDELDCWELQVPGGVEVDIDLQVFGWGNAAGSPTLGAIQATVIPAGYNNGVGAPLNPKGWPGSPENGAYQAHKRCEGGGDLSPCTAPFDPTCNGSANGVCVNASNWVMPDCTGIPLNAFATPTLQYAWASAAQFGCNTDDGEVKTFGGLILEVPHDAAGTYVIAIDPDTNNTFMNGHPIFGVQLTSACITVIRGACCVDTNSDGQQDSCQNDTSQSNCAAAAGSFAGDGSSCSGQVGACCLDGDLDGFDDTCTVKDRTCCFAEGGSFLGAGSSCSAEVGACCLDTDDDSFYDTCRVINQTCCDAQGGAFSAAGSRCSPIGGACCLDDGTCEEANATCCESQGGFSAGVGSVCRGDANGNGTDDSCDEGFPAVSEWGLGVMVLLLLVGIKICFARRRLGFRAW